MKRLFFLTYFVFFVANSLFSQSVGIGTNTPNSSAQLDITSTNKGVLVPRVTQAQMIGIASPANGLLIYNTDSACFAYRNATTWVFLKGNTHAGNNWSTKGNAGTDTSINFIGTTDDQDLIFKINNVRAGLLNDSRANTSFGVGALNPGTTSGANSAFGYEALFSNITGPENTATGYQSLYSNIDGRYNTAYGFSSLYFNVSGWYNTAIGYRALVNNASNSNTAVGYDAMFKNVSGYSNVVVGKDALYHSTNRSNLVAVGDSALFNNGTGTSNDGEAIANTAIGSKALYANTTGLDNTAVGFRTLNGNSTGEGNTAVGRAAMFYNSSGSSNSAFGKNALGLTSGDGNTAIGHSALVVNSGNHNTAVGMLAMGGDFSSGNNNTAMGYQAGSFNRGSGNVFLGYRAGENETGSNRLYISNDSSDATKILLYGEFDNRLLRSNGRLEINSDNTVKEGLSVKKNYAAGTNKNISAVYGENAVDDGWGIGLEGKGGRTGVQGISQGAGNLLTYTGVKGTADGANASTNLGVWGFASGSSFINRGVAGEAAGSSGEKFGVYGSATGGGVNYAVYGAATGGSTNYAGYFEGNVFANGKLTISTTAGLTGLDLSSSDVYAEMRVIRNTLNTTDKDLYFGFGSPAGSGLHLFSDGLETVTIKDNITGVGKLPSVSNNYGKLQVKQSAGLNAITMEAAGNTNHWDFYMPTVTNADLLLFYNGAGKGAFSNTTGAYTTNSDRRLKKDISPQADVLNRVMQLQAYQYHYLDNKSTDNFTNGFMAQDVQKIFPDAVVENTMKNGETRLGINYQYFTVLAIKSLQEQQQQIDVLKEQMKTVLQELEKNKNQ